MKTYNIGIIGYGGFGQFLHNSWKNLDKVRVTAVADEIPERNPGGKIKFYDRWQDLIEDKNLDIISIVTPPNSHSQIACAAMEAGKHILVEKPIATSIEEGRKILAVREKMGRVGTVNFMLRFNPLVGILGRLTADGIFGELRHANVENYAQDEGLPPEHWFWDHELAGGILIEHAVHFIDLVHSLTEQEFKRVYGLKHNRNPRQEDQVLAAVEYDGGLIATHYHAFSRPGFFENTSVRLVYDLAQIDIEGWIPLTGRISVLVSSDSKKKVMELPNFKIEQLVGVDQVGDDSRPEGWGSALQSVGKLDRRKVRSGGVEYEVEQMLVGWFDVGRPKQEVYADCVRGMMSDMVKKIENPDHKLRVTLEDGLSSLEIACLATDVSRQK
ncbi:MAG: Gfo/Idh/MocA family oxidoreductase [Planctomycetota bacterium]|nr:MAG: Gfo/Idh/MocA family oxidoreductase [Planctomycetota bacterium]